MGGYLLHGPCPGGFPGLCGATIDGGATAAAGVLEVGIHIGGGSKGGGGVQGDVGVHLKKSEHGHIVHCYTIASGPV